MPNFCVLDPSPAFIREAFQLPPSAAKTVAVIVRGGGKKVCARERDLCETTVKAHLTMAFVSSETRTQSALTAAVWRAWLATQC